MYQMKGLTMRNTHVKYEGPTTYQSKVMTKVSFVKVKLQDQRSEGQGQGIKCKSDLARRNTYVKNMKAVPPTNQKL